MSCVRLMPQGFRCQALSEHGEVASAGHSSDKLLVSRLETSATNPAQRGSARGADGRPIAVPREEGVQAVPRVLHQMPCEVSCW